MNKQALKKIVKQHLKSQSSYTTKYSGGKRYAYKTVLGLLEQLDEPQQPVVKQCVADWFEEHEDDLDNHIWDYIREWEDQDKDSDFYKWFNTGSNRIETLIRMKDGYKVEKELLYYVPLPDSNTDSQACYALLRDTSGRILIGLVARSWLGVQDNTKLTENEIKSLDEKYMVLAKLVKGMK